MKTCSLCEHSFDELFKPNEKLLGTKLSNVVKFVLCEHSLEIPLKFLICTECSLALIQSKIVLKRLSKAFPESRHLIRERKSINNQEINQKNDEGENTETCVNNSSNSSKSSIDWTFHCTYCEYSTTKSTLYKSHLKSKHNSNDPRIYECMFCTESYQRINGIKSHIEREHENRPGPIRKRRKTIAFDSPNVLSDKTVRNQIGNDTSLADTNKENYQARENMPYEFVCSQCNYKTIQSKFFKRHMLTRHKVEDIKIYKCKLCPSKYARKFAYNNHMAYEHENKPKPQRRKSTAADISLNKTANGELLLVKNEPEEEGEYLLSEHSLCQADNAHNADSFEKHKVIEHQYNSINTNGHYFNTTNHENHQQQQRDETEEHVFQVPQKRSRNQLSTSENPSVKWVFQCSYCDFESRKKKVFKTHLSDVHDIHDSEVYKCTYCPASYQRFSLLQQHGTSKHNIDLTSMSDTGAESDASCSQGPKKQKREVTPIRSENSIIIKREEELIPFNSFDSNEAKSQESCVVCGNPFSSLEELRSHMDKNHGGHEIKKLLTIGQRRSTIAFDSASVLSSTTIKNQLGNDTSVTGTNNVSYQVCDPNMPYEFVCSHCNYKTVQPKFYRKHMSTKHQIQDNKIYKCRKCPNTYARQFAYNNHIAYDHEKKPKPQRRKSIAADILLNKSANGKLLFLENEPEKEGRSLRCKHCLYQADNANSLKKHMVIVHQNDSINTNGLGFETSIHEEQLQQQRDETEEHVFQVPQKRSRNQLSTSENPSILWVFQCSYCDFESRKKKAFKTHLSDVHDFHDSEVYKCTYCPAAYQRFSLLQQHVTTKHNIDLTSMSDAGAESDASCSQRPKKQKREEKPIIIKREEEQTPVVSFKSNEVEAQESCVVCGKPFSSVKKLRSHMDKRHGGEEIKKILNVYGQFGSLEK